MESKDINYHLICADFNEFDFKSWKEKAKGNGYVEWCNEGKNHYLDLIVEADDIVYIYYKNVPDGINRILVKAKVVEANSSSEFIFLDEQKNIYKEIRRSIRLAFVAGLYSEEKPFSTHELINTKVEKGKKRAISKYNLTSLQGKQHLDKDKHKALISALESAFKDSKISLTRLDEYLPKLTKCIFKDCEHLLNTNGTRQRHETFKRQNGTNFVEWHHYIPKSTKLKNEVLEDIDNYISLCPNCHARIHNGNEEDKKIMITYLYSLKKEKYDQLLAGVLDETGKSIVGKELKWILKQYEVDVNEKEMHELLKKYSKKNDKVVL